MRLLVFIVFILLIFIKYIFALEIRVIAPQENEIENVVYKDTILPIVFLIYDVENEIIEIKIYNKDKIIFKDEIKNNLEKKEIVYKVDINVNESFKDIKELNIFIIGKKEIIFKNLKIIYNEEILNNLAKNFINDYFRYKGKILKIKNYPILVYVQNQFLDIVSEAIKIFEQYCNLKFIITDNKKDADIIVKDMTHIVMLDRLADCEYIFIGKDFYYFYVRNIINLYSFFKNYKYYFKFSIKVIAHELGHSLGINGHTTDYSIMSPFDNEIMILFPYQQQAIKHVYNK
jgi:hypothetical protein